MVVQLSQYCGTKFLKNIQNLKAGLLNNHEWNTSVDFQYIRVCQFYLDTSNQNRKDEYE
jgi:hypothetical protein